jgi:hypothetical protein
LVIHFGFDAPEAAAELTQGDEQLSPLRGFGIPATDALA